MQVADFLTRLQASGGAESVFGGKFRVSRGAGPTQPSVPSHSTLRISHPAPYRCLGMDVEEQRQRAGQETFHVMVLAGDVIPPYIFQEPFEDDIFASHE